MSLHHVPGLLLIGTVLWMASPSHAQWCAPTCDGVLQSGTQVLDPSSCLRYYVCSDSGTGTMQLSSAIDCPSGYVFDTYLTTPQCVPEASIHEGIAAYCSGYCNPCLPYCTSTGQLIPDPTNPQQYYICFGEGTIVPDPVACPVNEYFDYMAQECGVDVTKIFDFCDECEAYCVEAGIIPDPYDGCGYYDCGPPDKVPYQCPSGEYFSNSTLVCETEIFPGWCFTKC